MKSKTKRFVGLILVAFGALLAAGISRFNPPSDFHASFPIDFADRAYDHVVRLASGGARPASSAGERKAFDYVRDQFHKMGLDVALEEFDFESFEIDNMHLRLGEFECRPSFVAFNPYAGVFSFRGQATLVDATDLSSGRSVPAVENSFLITTEGADFFRLMLMKPRLIVYVSPSEFEKCKTAGSDRFALEIDGHAASGRSANLIAVVEGKAAGSREIIVSAHLDAYRNSPGADDNASGIGVLIELARYFCSLQERLDARVKFVVFGAEELGALGSRTYVTRHAGELQNCILNFNMDQIGGPTGPYVATQGGVAGIPERVGKNLFPAALMNKAWEPLHSNWRLLDPRVIPAARASNHPEWLKSLIEDSANATSVKIIQTANSGSDELSFTQAGVVATVIGYSGTVNHSPADVPAQVHKESLAAAGKLVAYVVENGAMKAPVRPSAEAGVQWVPENSISSERIARTVADISAGENAAQRRASVLQCLKELNIAYELENFCGGSACGINIVVEPDTAPGPSFMLGAHYDRVSKGKGAVDDASGVAAVLELLNALKKRPLMDHGLTAAFFNLEEAGMLGSKAYVSARQRHDALPACYLNFDPFGYGDTLWLMSTADKSPAVGAVRAATSRLNLGLTIESNAPPGDDQVFRDAGVEALGFSLIQQSELDTIRRALRGEAITSGSPLMKIVHSEEDTPDKVHSDDIARAVRGVEAAIRALDKRN